MISRKKLLEELEAWKERLGVSSPEVAAKIMIKAFIDKVNAQPEEDVTDINVGSKWIPFKERESDEEEKEMYGTSHMLDCKLPDDGEEILVTYSNGTVSGDVFVRDGYECYLESGVDLVDKAIAWQPLPEPWKGGADMRKEKK